ncbi:MAG: DNA polymerase, partial [Pseudohongiellaceae bacterium]
MKSKSPLVLVDGSSYLFRAFHALPPLVSSKGQPTGAIKGVISMIRSLIKNYPDSHIAIVFDAKGKTFRNEIYSEYKAHRPPMPDELRCQIEPIHAIVKAMGLPLLIVPEVEADDVIGTLATQATTAGIDTLVSTGDKDLAQLVSIHVNLLNTMTNEFLDSEGVEKKFGIPPERIIDFLALTGDKSDNIPGVPGVGPKTAIKWLQDYGSAEGIIVHADEIKGKIGERLRENIDALRLSYRLATIKSDVALDFGPDNLVIGNPDSQELHRLFSELEFKTWKTELEQNGIKADSAAVSREPGADMLESAKVEAEVPEQIKYQTIVSLTDLTKLIGSLESSGKFALSVEHENAHFMRARLTGIAVCAVAGTAFYIPLKSEAGMTGDEVMSKFKPLLEDKKITKIGYDLKTVCHLLANHGIELAPLKSDVLLASYVLNSVAIKHQLADMAKFYLELEPMDLDSLLGKGRNKLTVDQLPIEKVTDYAAEKADLILRLNSLLTARLRESGTLLSLYQYYEIPLIRVLQKMERTGVIVDAKALAHQSKELGKRLLEVEEQVYIQAGEEFNLGSPKQLQAILYEKLSLPVLKKTATGQPSTAEPVLQELALQYELPHL